MGELGRQEELLFFRFIVVFRSLGDLIHVGGESGMRRGEKRVGPLGL